MKKSNSRNKYLDCMKGVLMTLVVIGHLSCFAYNARTIVLIYSFHMPAFLIIGGYLSKTKDNDNIIKIFIRRFTSCLVPYLLFNAIALILFSNDATKMATIKTILLGIGEPNTAINLPTWFLTFYFSAMTIYDLIKYFANLIYKKTKNIYHKETFELIFTLICFSIGLLTWSYFRRVVWPPFNIEQALFCMPFIYLGDKIKYLIPYLKEKSKIIASDIRTSHITFFILTLFTITLFIIWYYFSMKNNRIDINARDFENKILFYIDSILGFILFSIFILFVNKIPIISSIFAYIGKLSLYVLGLHIPVITFLGTYIDRYIPETTLAILRSKNIYGVLYYAILPLIISVIIGTVIDTIIKLKKNS